MTASRLLSKSLMVKPKFNVGISDLFPSISIKSSYNSLRYWYSLACVLAFWASRNYSFNLDILDKSGFRTENTNIPLSYGSIYNSEGIEYRDVAYTPDMKRNFSIIDSQTGEEVKPSLYRDENGNVKGRCKIMPNRPYIVLEVTMDDEAIAKHLLMEEEMNTNASIV